MVAPASPLKAQRFIRDNLPLAEPHGLAGLRLHRAVPASGLARFLGEDGGTPYWAYAWPGGLALARHLIEHPDLVRGRRVLDFGAGSGIVAIAAMRSGAASALAVDTDALAAVATELNAEANGVTIATRTGFIAPDEVDAELILAADTFYAEDVARAATVFLAACAARGIDVLVGDIGRRFLPFELLRAVAEYEVSDIGNPTEMQTGKIFSLLP
ncbi:MAG: 50S ribosomal protein L11 methyltransferase [Alphaproteobacteria bacterium]|nr:50S ribosomal protein L11 methyltransferase [Alphaproteobacteria bacterium]